MNGEDMQELGNAIVETLVVMAMLLFIAIALMYGTADMNSYLIGCAAGVVLTLAAVVKWRHIKIGWDEYQSHQTDAWIREREQRDAERLRAVTTMKPVETAKTTRIPQAEERQLNI